jgi:hypothetical protein
MFMRVAHVIWLLTVAVVSADRYQFRTSLGGSQKLGVVFGRRLPARRHTISSIDAHT